MYGDAATGALGFAPMARFNPLRCSGSLTLDAAIKQIEEVAKDEKSKTRPIVVKLPSGVRGKESRVPDADAAIKFLQDNDPVKIAAEKAKREAEEAATVAAAAEAAEKKKLCQVAKEKADESLAAAENELKEIEENMEKSKDQLKELTKNMGDVAINQLNVETTVKCDWMYSDAGEFEFIRSTSKEVHGALKGKLDLFARYNPFRWSGEQPLLKTLEEMARENKKNQQRPIRMKVTLEDGKKEEKAFNDSQEALDYLPTLCPALKEVAAARLKATSDLAAEESLIDTLKETLQKATEAKTKAQTAVDDAAKALAACGESSEGYAKLGA
jgi:hypothetical protein